MKRNYRPYYQLFRKPTQWPKIELSRDDGAFRLSPRKNPTLEAESTVVNQEPANMTRKSRSRSLQRGVPNLKKSQLHNGGRHSSEVAAPAAATGVQLQKDIKDSSDKQCGVCEICKI